MASPLDPFMPHIEAKAVELGFELYEARFFGAGPRSVLRITIDKEDGSGVSVADCELMSGAVSALLDEGDFFGGKAYTLEVSSPGIGRPLKTERDFRRVLNKDITLNLDAPVNGKKTCKGKLTSCVDGTLTIDTGKDTVDIAITNVLSGKEELKF